MANDGPERSFAIVSDPSAIVMRILVETLLPAPPETAYAMLLDPAVHARTASGRERVVDVTPHPQPLSPGGERGVLGPGDEVTFEATHFGVRQRLTARITLVDPPFAFEDTMIRGFFRLLWHWHEFHPHEGGTRMLDEMEFASPLGGLFDRLVLGSYLARFLEGRGDALRGLLQ